MSESKSSSNESTTTTTTKQFPVQNLQTIYQSVIQEFYETKVKEDKKRGLALETDTWRYEELPELLRKRPADEGISKQELERLVEWKITHGTFRPFLLPQIRKNSEESVQQATARARALLTITAKSTALRSTETVRKALDAACVLSGVGPATGTLLLSVFDPDGIPFFQDELFAWLVSEHKDKLKYNVKEYLLLLDRAAQKREELKARGLDLTAWELEKVGFVMEHRDRVPQDRKGMITDLEQVIASGNHGSKKSAADGVAAGTRKTTIVTTEIAGDEATSAKREDAESESDDKGQHVSKRQKLQHPNHQSSQKNTSQPTRRSLRNKK